MRPRLRSSYRHATARRDARSRHQERTSNERGQTLVEFAALLPVLCLLLFGIIQFGVVFHDYITVTDASRVGARKAAVSRFVGDSGASAEAAASSRRRPQRRPRR